MNKKDYINLGIGVLIIAFGFFLFKSKITIIHYLGLLLMVYGVFVIIIKLLKSITLSQGKFKNIRNFEFKENLTIPKQIRNVLEFRIKNNNELNFAIPFFGDVKVFDYTSNEENFRNPFFALAEIKDYLKEFYPVISFNKIIPIAYNNNFGYIFSADGNQNLIYINNDSNLKPIILKNIDAYIDIRNLIFENNQYYYNGLKKLEDLVPESDYFYDVPDSVFEAKDYLEMLQKSFRLVDKNIQISFSKTEEVDDKYLIELYINDKPYGTYFNKHSHYIDNERFTLVLNEMLDLEGIPHKRFYPISRMFADFGYVFADENTYSKLYENGAVEFDERNYQLTQSEKNVINDAKSIEYEIENIEFYIKVIRKNNQLITGNQYHFDYKLTSNFDKKSLKKIEKKLNIQILNKTDNCEIFFIA